MKKMGESVKRDNYLRENPEDMEISILSIKKTNKR